MYRSTSRVVSWAGSAPLDAATAEHGRSPGLGGWGCEHRHDLPALLHRLDRASGGGNRTARGGRSCHVRLTTHGYPDFMKMRTRNLFAGAVVLALGLALAAACEETLQPEAGIDQETIDRILDYTSMPVDGLWVTDGEGERMSPLKAGDVRFAMFATDIAVGEAVITSHDAGVVRPLPRRGTFARYDGRVYYRGRIAIETTARDLAAMAIAGVLPDNPAGMVAASMVAASQESLCSLSDYKNQPSAWDFIRNTDRAQEFKAYGACVDSLLRGLEELEGRSDRCFSWSEFDDATETFTLHSGYMTPVQQGSGKEM